MGDGNAEVKVNISHWLQVNNKQQCQLSRYETGFMYA